MHHTGVRRRGARGGCQAGGDRGVSRHPGSAHQRGAPRRRAARLGHARRRRRRGALRDRGRRPRHRARGPRQGALARPEGHARAHRAARRVARDRACAARWHAPAHPGAARRPGARGGGVIRVLVADDHKIVRDGLKRILASAPDIECAAEAADGDQALALVRAQDFDLAMLDMSMPGLAGIDLIKRLKIEKPTLRILVLSMHGERQYAARALKAGAAGYLNKDSAAEALLGAIRKIAAGGLHISEAAAASLLGDGARAPHEALSDREFEVLRLLVEGLSPTEIGDKLHLSVKTVSTHKSRILDKLKLDSTAELVRYALDHKLV